MLGITVCRERYERWWLGKYCRPTNYSNKPFKKVVKIDLLGPPSFVSGQLTFHYKDGTEDIVAGGENAYKPRLCDVEIQMQENTMTEYERVREQALLTDEALRGVLSGLTDSYLPMVKRVAQAQLDKALKTDGIEIRADDQSLPSVRNAVNKSYNDYMLGQEDMLKAGFIKVAPKGIK